MNALIPPLAIIERGDIEFTFFTSLKAVLDDSYDLLWADAYEG